MNFKHKRSKNTGQSKQRGRREKALFKIKDHRILRRAEKLSLLQFQRNAELDQIPLSSKMSYTRL